VVWSVSGEQVFIVTRDGRTFVWSWSTSDSSRPDSLRTSFGRALSVERCPVRDLVAIGGEHGLVLWWPDTGEWTDLPPITRSGELLAWSSDGQMLSLVDAHQRDVIWIVRFAGQDATPIGVATLEGALAPIVSAHFTSDSRLISAHADRGIAMWDIEKMAHIALSSLEGSLPADASFLGFSPSGHRLAEVSPDRDAISVYDFSSLLLHRTPSMFSGGAPVISTSAKVVIAGEARVGKTSLAHRIAETTKGPYVRPESTHGVRFWSLPPERLAASDAAPAGERREVVLWDLGGQKEYQLIHQLFLGDTTVALILFDPLQGDAALDQVEAWDKRLAKQTHGQAPKKLLVATKVDDGGQLARHLVEQIRARVSFVDCFPTSAQEGQGIDKLRAAIAAAIDWKSVSKVHRPELFQRTRDEIERRRERGEVVVPLVDLRNSVRGLKEEDYDDAAVDTVVRQLCLQGAIAEAKDAAGERTVILQIGAIEEYAGSLIFTAKSNPAGVPAIERSFLASRPTNLPKLKNRLPFREERWVLECVLRLLLEHGLCIEHAGLYVFPALFPRTDTFAGEAPPAASIFYEFSGAIDNIYSSLVAAVALSGHFGKMRLWDDRAEFEAAGEAMCGVHKVDRQGGVAHLDVYFGPATTDDTQKLFLSFVQEHLAEHGVELVEKLQLSCRCGWAFDEVLLRQLLAASLNQTFCPKCGTPNAITPGAEAARSRDTDLTRRTLLLRQDVAKERKNVVERAKALISDHEPVSARRPAWILHLSDLHVAAEDDPEALLQPLLADLRDLEGDIGLDGPQYLVISGDLTQRASSKEFDKAYELVSRLIEALSLSAHRCLIVPGNHDLSWEADVYQFMEADKPPAGVPACHWIQKGTWFRVRNTVKYPLRFENFSKHFFHPLMQRQYPLEFEQQGLSVLCAEHGLQFVLLNSSWEIDQHFRDRHGVHLGAMERAIDRANEDLKDAVARGTLAPGAPVSRIAVWHHPITGNEKMKDDAFLERLRQEDFRLCLHGHVHEDRTDLVNHVDPVRRLAVIGAGSFGAPAKDRPESTPCLYNLLEIDAAHRLVRVHTRGRPCTGGSWGPWARWPGPHRNEPRPFYEIPIAAPYVVR